jgi:hypothetical protein
VKKQGVPRFAQQSSFPHHIAMVASRKMREAPRPTGAKLGAPALGAIHLRSKFFWFVTVDIHVGSDDVTIRQRGLVAICHNLVSVMFPKTLLSKTARVQKIWGKKKYKMSFV